MRLLISGMAPLNRNICRFFDRMQLPLCESYGLAETGSLTYRPPFSKKHGSVGKPLRGVTISFESDGEIIVHREKFLTRKYFQSTPGKMKTPSSAATVSPPAISDVSIPTAIFICWAGRRN